MNRIAALTAAVAITATVAPVPLASAKTTDAKFNYQASSVCSSAGAKLEAMPALTEENLLKSFKQNITIVDGMVKRLDKVEAPASSKGKFKHFISLVRQGNVHLKAGLASARAHHVNASADQLFQAVKLGQRSVTVANDLALTDCSRDYYLGADDAIG